MSVRRGLCFYTPRNEAFTNFMTAMLHYRRSVSFHPLTAPAKMIAASQGLRCHTAQAKRPEAQSPASLSGAHQGHRYL
jgi:hypothetical protein